MEIIFYILKVGAIYTALYLIYFAFFRNNTYFQINRIYLILIIPLSFILPIINTTIDVTTQYQVALPVIELNASISETINYTWEDVLPFLYYVCSTIVLVILVKNLYNTIKIIYDIKSGVYRAIQPFSFFSFIYVDDKMDSEDRNSIIAHEKAHSDQLHSYDILTYEICKILLWWNPFIWMGLNSVKSNHEFIADKLASVKASKYSSVLVAQLLGVNCSVLTNNFKSKLLIKKRIMMLKTKKSNKISLLKYALVIPVIALTIAATPIQNEMSSNTSFIQHDFEKNYDEVDIKPKFKGGNNALMKYLGSNINYPEEAKSNKIEGLVFVSFIIDKKGNVKDVSILKPIHPLLDKEAKRVVAQMPKWVPGKKDGKNVAVNTKLPIKFKLR